MSIDEDIQDAAKETQEGLFVMKWRNFIPMMLMVIVGTNTASIFYQKQNRNSEAIAYNNEANKRRILNAIEISELKHDKEALEIELIKCRNGAH